MSLFTGHIPPTCNHEFPDEDCTQDIVTQPRQTNPNNVLVNAKGVGIVNASMVLSKATAEPPSFKAANKLVA